MFSPRATGHRFLPMGALALLTVFLLSMDPTHATAEPCLMVYPDGPSIYHYESAENYLVGPGHPLYDPAYDRGGWVLIDANTDEIALEVYQAPNLSGFELDEENQGWYFEGTFMDLVVDGFSNTPTTYANVTLVFEALANSCMPNVMVNGQPAQPAPDGTYHFPIGDLVVQTPAGQGNNYSDITSVALDWSACAEIDVWAWADENGDGIRQGFECRTAFSKNTTVPTESGAWGALKVRYED